MLSDDYVRLDVLEKKHLLTRKQIMNVDLRPGGLNVVDGVGRLYPKCGMVEKKRGRNLQRKI